MDLMSFWPREDIENFFKWLWPKFEWQILMAGAVGLGLLGIWAYLQLTAPGSPSSAEGYRYPGLPERCVCHECGYVVENPSKHCPDLGPCPKCGAPRLWRG